MAAHPFIPQVRYSLDPSANFWTSPSHFRPVVCTALSRSSNVLYVASLSTVLGAQAVASKASAIVSADTSLTRTVAHDSPNSVCPTLTVMSRDMVKIDVDAVGKMLDELLAPIVRSPYEELEPDHEYMPERPRRRVTS